MTHKTIQTENYLLVADDSEIQQGDWAISGTNTIVKCIYPDSIVDKDVKKIIAHLPLNNSPILEGVYLLPPLPDEAEMMAEEYSKNYYDDNAQDDVYHGFFQGYNKAKEQFRYTEEDLRKAYDFGSYNHHAQFTHEYDEQKNSHIQSLKEPKMPIGFSLEAKDTHTKNGVIVKSQWVGTWIFEKVYKEKYG